MTTPAPKTAAAAPFDPHDFPGDLVAAQHTEAELYADLHAFQKTLPWSRESHDGWPDEAERGRERRGRSASPGWTSEQAAEFDRLFVALRRAAAAVGATSGGSAASGRASRARTWSPPAWRSSMLRAPFPRHGRTSAPPPNHRLGPGYCPPGPSPHKG
ncbi:hypothetical protein AB0942_28940 [Streptomyces nodosus]|uniref:hypothetical protein n=1 Tax=Streptomyces nodosus TaxID=40318 RepID=UPI0034544A1A